MAVVKEGAARAAAKAEVGVEVEVFTRQVAAPAARANVLGLKTVSTLFVLPYGKHRRRT